MATDTDRVRQRDPYHLTFPPTHRRQIQPKRRRHAIRNGSCEHGGARERDKLATVASRWKDCRFTPRSGCKRPAPIKTRHRFIRQAVAIVVTFYHSFTTIAMSVCLQVIPATDRDDCTARGDMARAESATLQLETGVAHVPRLLDCSDPT